MKPAASLGRLMSRTKDKHKASQKDDNLQRIRNANEDRLRSELKALRAKCGRLEAQNILVAVQQLDILTRSVAVVSSVLCLCLYWKALSSVFFVCDWSSITQLVPQISKEFSSVLCLLSVVVRAASSLTRVVLYALPFFHHRRSHGLLYRRFEVFAVFTIVIVRMKLCRWRERMFAVESSEEDDDSEEEDSDKAPAYGSKLTEDDIWDANYEISARFLYVSILRLQGLWTKSAQYLSSRADFMPASYVRELQKLQDSAPQTPWEKIVKIIPKHILEELSDVEQTAMASASIGQVHVAKLRKTGEQVVVKVQHPQARTLLLDDFWSLNVFCRIVRYLEPEYAFLEALMREWATEARKELNFLQERENLKDAAVSIQQMPSNLHTNGSETVASVPFNVEIPKPYEELCTQDVLVMSFSEGFRIDDVDQIKASGLSPVAVMDSVAQTFAHMMYVAPPFNGDPHTGNLLVRPGTVKSPNRGFTIVLLDWGLAKRLPRDKRFAFCQMAYAAATFDFGLLLDSFETIGLKMKRENTAEDMEGVRFLFREIVPPEVSRKRIKAKIKTDMNRRKSLSKGKKVPMESKAYPGEFFFYVRVNELLHGLGSKYGIEFSYIEAIKPYARRGLELFIVESDKGLADKPVPISRSSESILAERVSDVVKDLKRQGSIAGAQVCVIKNGEPLVHVVDGHMGGLKKEVPMRPDALILGYSCTKAVAATLAHIMVSEGYLTYDEPVCERVWKSFAPFEEPPLHLPTELKITEAEARERWAWKRQITLRHILTHSAGLWSALPAKLTVKMLSSCEQCVSAFEYHAETPDEFILPISAPSSVTAYHFMSFGWLVAGPLIGAYALKNGLDRKSVTFEQIYGKILAPRLSKETLATGFRPCGGAGEFPVALTETEDIKMSRLLQMEREAEAQGQKRQKGNTEMQRIRELFKGKEFMLDQRIWNCKEGLNANCPAASGRFSANGLAQFYSDLGNGKILDKEIVDEASSVVAEEFVANSLQGQTNMMAHNRNDRGHALGMGYQLIRFKNDSDKQPGAFGHAGVGGSIGFHHSNSGISVGIMLNKADGDRNTASSIVQMIAEHFRW